MAYRNIEIYIVQPKEATNLVTNPSVELATTGYTAVGASSSIARTATNGNQRRGTYGLDITPTSGADSGVYFGTVALTSGVTYTFSCDVKDVAGQTFSINFVAADGSPSGTATSWTGDGYWKRKAVTWACSSSENYRLYLTRASVASTTHFYTDGWQCEVGAESTYLDGDMRGYHRQRIDYWWTGTQHASTSVRSGATRQGGTLFRLRDYCTISSIIGLGMPTVENNASETSGIGSYYQNTRIVERTLDIGLDFYSQTGGYSTIAANRAAVIGAIQPDNVPANEPLRLMLQFEDSSGYPSSDMCILDCVYEAGLAQNLTNNAQYVEKALVSFMAFDPLLKLEGNVASTLAITTSVANTAYLIYRTRAGVWTSAGVVNGAVHCIVEDANGRIIVGGAFTSIGGTAANRVAYSADGGVTWSAMSTGLAATVYALAVAPNGYIYAGGAALAPGGTTSSVAVWNGSAWAAPAGSNNPGTTVYALAFGPSGELYIGGSYSTAGGATVNGICYLLSGSYVAMASGISGSTVRSIAVGNKIVFVGGEVSGAAVVYSWNGTSWTNMNSALGDACYSLALDKAGRLYATGYYTPGASTIGIWDMWNGASWYSARTPSGYTPTEPVRKVYVLPNNHKVFLGSVLRFGQPTDMPYNTSFVRLGGSNVYYYQDIALTIGGGEYIADCLYTKAGTWWLAGTWTATTAAASNGVTSITLTGARAYPVITMTGPGSLVSIINHTTGRELHFDNLTMLDGETLILDLRRGQISFTSSWRGNVLKYIKVGSDIDWFLQRGTNSIGVQVNGSSGASSMTMAWNPPYHAFDTVAR